MPETEASAAADSGSRGLQVSLGPLGTTLGLHSDYPHKEERPAAGMGKEEVVGKGEERGRRRKNERRQQGIRLTSSSVSGGGGGVTSGSCGGTRTVLRDMSIMSLGRPLIARNRTGLHP